MQAGCPALLAGAHSFCFRLKGLALFSLEIFSERERGYGFSCRSLDLFQVFRRVVRFGPSPIYIHFCN